MPKHVDQAKQNVDQLATDHWQLTLTDLEQKRVSKLHLEFHVLNGQAFVQGQDAGCLGAKAKHPIFPRSNGHKGHHQQELKEKKSRPSRIRRVLLSEVGIDVIPKQRRGILLRPRTFEIPKAHKLHLKAAQCQFGKLQP